MDDKTTRVIVDLAPDALRALEALAAAHGSTMTDAINQALVNERYLLDRRVDGDKLLLEKPDGTFRIVTLPRPLRQEP